MVRANEIEFDGWTLNLNSGELRKADRSIRLRPQPLQVLEELLAHPGEVVSRAHLIARLWHKGIVDFDTALNSAVRRLRKALLDAADAPKYIETLPRKGYRFIGSITPTLPAESTHVSAVATSALTVRYSTFSRRLPTVMTACVLGAVGISMAMDSHQRIVGATATARSIAATATVSKAQVFQFLETQFARADSNHDGALDAGELSTFVHAVARSDSDRQ
jgi:DNA-binding winged helix-turn-helix (wHTH) protein